MRLQISFRRLCFAAPICIAAFSAACASEDTGAPVNLTATESIKSSESSQTEEFCMLEFPEKSIDEIVRVGDMRFFLVNAMYRDKQITDECRYLPEPDAILTPGPIFPTEVGISRLAESLVFSFSLPTWAPDDFEFSNDALVFPGDLELYEKAVEQGESPSFSFSTQWRQPGIESIVLDVAFRGGAIRQRILAGSLEVPELEAGSAALVRGVWTVTEDTITWGGKWLSLTLDVGGNLRYEFRTNGDWLTDQDLIRMAESMKPFP